MPDTLVKHVLIVDDHPGVRGALRAIIESRGYFCDEVPDGAAALSRLETGRFDLVITDYQMPVMNGLQLLESLSARRGCLAQPIIFHTASPDESLARRALDAGAYRVLAKPSSPTEVLSTVEQAMEMA